MKKLHYIGYCYGANESELYKCNVASNIKMHYISSSAKRAGFDVVFLSMCKAQKKFFMRGRINRLETVPLKHIASFGKENKFFSALNLLLYRLQLFFYILFKVKKDDTVLIYHSMRLTGLLSKFKKLKKCHYILEVEEIYSFAADGIKEYHAKEIALIQKFEQFIFVNSYIPKELEIDENKYITVYGSYELPKVETEKYRDGKVHVLYAGAIEKLNNGAFTAIQTARFLPNNFIVHIIGKGMKEHVEEAKNIIKNINEETGVEKIVYDGFFSGEELDEYMGRCHIGVGTYSIQDSYSNYIFPSKLVSYMCRNLKVVTGRSDCYMNIPISRNWVYYDYSDYETIAAAIMQAAQNSMGIDNKTVIIELDAELVNKFKSFYQNGKWC